MTRRPLNIIYGLVDPITRLIHYVGLSTRGLQRPKMHRLKAYPVTHCRAWVQELQAKGLDYEIAILEEFRTPSRLPEAERWWIAYGKCCGWPLTNQTRGGELAIEDEVQLRRFRKRVQLADYAHNYEEGVMTFCKHLYQKGGVCANRAVEMARRRLTPAVFDRFSIMVVKHDMALYEELPPRTLICPCGHQERFHDSDSLTNAVHKMNSHIREMAQLKRSVAAPRWKFMRQKTNK